MSDAAGLWLMVYDRTCVAKRVSVGLSTAWNATSGDGRSFRPTPRYLRSPSVEAQKREICSARRRPRSPTDEGFPIPVDRDRVGRPSA
jgi:hypothetical protein